MMLQNMVNSSVEAAVPFASNHDKRELLYEWVPVKIWKSSSGHGELSRDDSDLLNDSHPFTVHESNRVHKRRKLEKKSDAIALVNLQTDEALVGAARNSPSHTNNRNEIDGGSCVPVISLELVSAESRSRSTRPDQEFSSGSVSSTKSEVEAHLMTDESRVHNMADSSDSELEVLDDLSIRDLCTSVLRNHGLIAGDLCNRSISSENVSGSSDGSNFFQTCELCGSLDDTRKMLLCDHCDEAFHVSCCSPKTRMSTMDDWFCQFCSKLSVKVSPEIFFLKSCSITGLNGMSPCKLGPIARMLKYPRPFRSRARIGDSFQADVPEWSNQISKDCDFIGEPMEINPEDMVNFHGCFRDKFLKHDSISNWLQCQEVLYDDARGGEAAICGKWRRAPISQVQTNDWDCSCAVLWDPCHSDCAVPQELETDQVLLQLKYVEQLRTRLTARKRP